MPYSAAVEKGHDIKSKGVVVGHVQAYPFADPAVKDKLTMKKCKDVIKAHLVRGLKI